MADGSPFHAALARYADAVRAKDVDAFAAIYAPDVHVFDMWGRWSLQGIASWRAMADHWFASLGQERVRVDFHDAHAMVGHDLVAGHATATYTAMSANGGILRALDNRFSLVLRRDADAWKVIHEHTSAPIDEASMKAILRRTP